MNIKGQLLTLASLPLQHLMPEIDGILQGVATVVVVVVVFSRFLSSSSTRTKRDDFKSVKRSTADCGPVGRGNSN